MKQNTQKSKKQERSPSTYGDEEIRKWEKKEWQDRFNSSTKEERENMIAARAREDRIAAAAAEYLKKRGPYIPHIERPAEANKLDNGTPLNTLGDELKQENLTGIDGIIQIISSGGRIARQELLNMASSDNILSVIVQVNARLKKLNFKLSKNSEKGIIYYSTK